MRQRELVDHAVRHAGRGLGGQAGIHQAHSLVDHLRSENIDAIYSSHLIRAVQTVEPLAADRGLDIVIDERLREWVSGATAYTGTEGMVAMFKNVVSMANNHGMDFGVAGLQESLAIEQAKAIVTTAKGSGWTEDTLKAYLKKYCKVSRVIDVPARSYDDVISAIELGPDYEAPL